MSPPSFALAIALVLPFASVSTAAEPKDLEFFESQVRPLLAARCLECHGPDAQKGGLRLDTGAGVRNGGDSGAVLTPGRPDDSLLIEAIGYRGDIKMPPKSKLPAAEIATLTDWVKRGAPWPDEGPTAPRPTEQPDGQFSPAQTAWWSFQPIRDPAPPVVTNTDWCQSPLDRFVLAKLEANGLSPAPPADKRTLLRRVTFDLTGLPPTPEELAAFLADDSPEAFARVVDRLLASQHYGERWGRHWLDVARYADSNGLDENLAYANAWRYRDYVIGAFNADTPYDVFVREQLAGDLLPETSDEALRLDRIVATGFLSLGAKMLAEDDPVKMQMDIIDEQVDTLGRTLLGLTLGCARCHDHKFDPVGADDYYALAGIFKSTKTMENFSVVARWQERPLATASAVEQLEKARAVIAGKRDEADKLRTEAAEAILVEERKHVAEYLRAVLEGREQAQYLASVKPLEQDDEPLQRDGAILREAESYDRGNVIKDTRNYGVGIGVLVNRGELPNFAEYDLEVPGNAAKMYLLAIRVAAAGSRPTRFLVDGRMLKSDVAKIVTGSWTPESQRWSIETLVPLAPGKHVVRLECPGPFPHIDKLLLSPTDLPARAMSGFTPKPEFVQQWDEFLKANANSPFWSKLMESASGGAEIDLSSTEQGADAPRSPGFAALTDPKGPFAIPPTIETYFDPATQQSLTTLRDGAAALEKSLPKLPEAMAVSDDAPQNLRVHLRGSHLTLGKEVPRRFLRVVAGENQTPIDPTRSGRLELAQWLTRPDHPLTARVMVNRVWQGHFGEGLVRSPDNFGLLGETPSHPELLDWLATRFIEDGWSLKALHRRILLSSTWQMSTAHNATAAQVDPENRLLWRMNRRRLEAEAIRDAMLAVAGTLDARMGGTELPTANRAYVTSTANVNPVVYDSPRRSVYLPVVRSALYEVFQAFDFADPSVQNGRRDVTTVAPQALFMMNSAFASRQSQALAERVLQPEGLEDSARVRLACEIAIGNVPDADRLQRMCQYLKEYTQATGDPRQAWQSLCRTLMAANEFVYVE